ncbi:MAG: signal peptidase [Gaiellales bacterium]|nr:signal peptidase [Gaiellales bacterium]MDX6593363.1 signal peptidase [Gaiellales bacterium]
MIPPPFRAIVELVLTLVVAGALAYLAQAYVVKPYRVPTESMAPTLQPGDRVIADRITLSFRDPNRGEIVVFHPPVCKQGLNFGGACTTSDVAKRIGASTETFIKRVVGLPGETIWGKDGHVWIQVPGQRAIRLTEDYLKGRRTTGFPKVRIADDCYFMMGDNRPHSDDSRQWGCEPRKDILGVARVRYWPVDRIGLL